MNKYPPHLLLSFIRFAELRNMTKASDSLGISQPALTRQLQQLDSLVGKKLFQKRGRQKILTPVGKELITQLKFYWKDYDALVDSVLLEFGQRPQRPLRIYGPSEILERLAIKLENNFPIIFVPTRSQDVASRLSDDDFNIGITRIIEDSDEFIAKKLFHEDFYLTFSSAWKVTSESCDKNLIHNLSKYPVVSYAEDFNFPVTIAKEFGLQRPFEVIRTIPSWASLINLVEKQVGWAVVPQGLRPMSKKISSIRIPADLYPPVTYYLTYRKAFSKVNWFKSVVSDVIQAHK